MMTAKEYVEDKVKSYTRLSESCRREAEASDDIVVRAGYSARANVWEMCAECPEVLMGANIDYESGAGDSAEEEV